MDQNKTTAGRVFTFVEYGSAQAFLIFNKVSRRSAWVNEADARGFYAALAAETGPTVDSLLSMLWYDAKYVVGSHCDAIA